MTVKLCERHPQAFSSLYLAIVYIFGVISSGAWSDDYAALLDPSAVGLHALRDSRPLYGTIISSLFGIFDSITGLAYLRFFGLFGLILLNNELWIRLRKYPNRRALQIICTFGLTLPSFQFSSHWAIAFVMSWATWLGLYGLRMFSIKNLLIRAFGLFLLVLSLLIYPLVIFFVFAAVFVEGLLSKDGASELLRRFAQPCYYLLIGIPISYIISQVALIINKTTSNGRVEIVTFEDIPEKLMWFFTRPWALSFRPFLISSPNKIETFGFVFTFSILIFLLMVSYFRSIKNALYIFSIFNLTLVLSVLPLLIVSQNQIDVRFVGSNTWLVLVTLLFLLNNFCIRKVRLVKSGMIPLGGAILLIFGFWSINDRYVSFIQPIFVANNEFIQSEISKCGDSYPEMKIDIIKRTKPWERKPLLGFYSQVTDLESEWVPVGAVYMFLKSNGTDLKYMPNMASWLESKSECEIILDRYQVKP